MKPYPLQAHARKHGRRGFALIVVMMMLALLLMLGVGMLSTSSITLRQSGSATAMAEARANARMAMIIALGQLQKHAGPDLCSTARADITGPTAAAPGGSQPKLPWLTGVWRSEDLASPDPNGVELHLKRPTKFPAFLISGNEAYDVNGSFPAGYITPDSTLPGGKGNAPGSVEVGFTSYQGKAQKVQAPLLAVPSTNSSNKGGYAYWVDDEGVKARMDLTNPFSKSSKPLESMANDLLGQRNRIDWIAKGGQNPLPGKSLERLPTDGNSPLFGKMVSLSDAALASDDPMATSADLKLLSADLTTSSKSLLVDMKRGGFRRDLTTALDPSKPNSNLQNMIAKGVFDSEYAYPQQGKASNAGAKNDYFNRPPGADWSVFKDYLNYAATRPASNPAMAMRFITTNNDSAGQSIKLNHISQFTPVVNRVQVFFNVTYVSKGTVNTTTTYDIIFHILPMIELWNPFDTDMQVPAFQVNITPNRNVSFHQNLFAFKYRLNGNYTPLPTSAPTSPNGVDAKSSGQTSNPVFRQVLTFRTSNLVTLPAGKCVVMSPSASVDWTNNGAGLNLASSWNKGAGYTYKLGTISITPPQSLPSITLLNSPPGDDSVFVGAPTTGGRDFGTESLIFSQQLGFLAEKSLWDIDGPYNGQIIPTFTPTQHIARNLPLSIAPRWGAMLTRKTPGTQFSSMTNSGDNANALPAKTFGDHNLLARHFSNVGLAVRTPSEFFTGTVLNGGLPITSQEIEPNIANGSSSGPHYAYVGGSDQFGTDTHIAYHIPRDNEPILSLAQFSQANLSVPYDLNGHNGRNKGDDINPSYPIGNSQRPPHMPTDKVTVFTGVAGQNPSYLNDWDFPATPANAQAIHRADVSFLYNNALWDTYFLSGYNATTKSFLNNRLQWGTENKTTQANFASDPKNALANVFLKGGFNVNSTSKAAWKALLASTVGVRNSSNGSPANKAGYGRIYNSQVPFESLNGGTNAVSPEAYDNQRARQLTEDEIDQLAEHIVDQVKLRGPFPSLADFVNRSLNPDFLARKNVDKQLVCNQGALQAAIDGIGNTTDINKSLSRSQWVDQGSLPSGTSMFDTNKAGHLDPKACEGARATGAPFYLMPSDLLSKIGPCLTARSDTFKIYAYGESRDANGKLLASVKCEAIVQRSPDWVGGRLAAIDPAQANTLEERFGRQFQIVNFRWLTKQDEI